MPAPTVLFLGHHVPLLHQLRNQIGKNFRVRHCSQAPPSQYFPDLQDVSMIVVQHDPARKDMLPDVCQFQREVPGVPVVVFTSDFSGSNARAFLKSGAADVFPLNTSSEAILACYEAYLPGFKFGDAALHQSRQVSVNAGAGLRSDATAPPGEIPAPHVAGAVLSEAAAGGLNLRFLGFFSAAVNGRRIDFTKQAKLLFAYLAHNQSRAFSPDHLARVFWPEKQENQPDSARRSLNVELATIRRALRTQVDPKQDFILYEKNQYRLQFDCEVHSDILYFKELCQNIHECRRIGRPVSNDMYAGVIRAYHGEFLEECPLETMNWVEVERQHYSAAFEQMADQYTAQLFLESDFWKTTAVCNEILTRDPNIEVIHRRLMLCYAQLGMCNKMEAQFRLLCQILKTRFQSNPSAETLRVYGEIKHEFRC